VILTQLEEVSVAIENRHDWPMSGAHGDFLRTGSGRDPRSDGGIAKIMDSEWFKSSVGDHRRPRSKAKVPESNRSPIRSLKYTIVRSLAANTHSFWSDFGAGIAPTLLGYEARRAEEMDSIILSGSNYFALILGDFSNYVIAYRIGTTIANTPMVMGGNQRPTGQAGRFAYGRTGADVITSNAFKVLKL
jgi:hypothetical protein